MDLLIQWVGIINNSMIVKGLLSFACTAFVALFGAPQIAMGAVGGLIILDLFTKAMRIAYENGGPIKALKKGKYKSRIASDRSLYKLFRYAVTIISWHLASLIAPPLIMAYGYPVRFWIDLIGYIYVGWCEIVSIFENLVGIDGEDIKPLSDAVRNSRSRLTDRLLDAVLDRIAGRISERQNGGK